MVFSRAPADWIGFAFIFCSGPYPLSALRKAPKTALLFSCLHGILHLNARSRKEHGMSKATKKSLLYALAALGLIALAMWLRYASRTVLHSPVYNHLRSGIYIFLLCAWCHSVWVRIVQTQVQRYLLAI